MTAELGRQPRRPPRVWEAIALHSSAGLADRMGLLTYLTHKGVFTDGGRFAELFSEVAQSVAPGCRVVYVDNDPVVLSHARALLTSSPEGVTSYVDADARDPGAILAQARAVLDFGEPVAVIMVDLLNFIGDDQLAGESVSALTAAVPSGSYLVIMHPASDLDPALLKAGRRWNQLAAQPVRLRSRQEVTGFLAGLELVEPGLVTVPEWRPDPGGPVPGQPIPLYGVVARKP